MCQKKQPKATEKTESDCTHARFQLPHKVVHSNRPNIPLSICQHLITNCWCKTPHKEEKKYMFKHLFTPTTLYLRCTMQLHYAPKVKMADKVNTESKVSCWCY